MNRLTESGTEAQRR